MKQRKYEVVKVIDEVYVSSSGHHFFKVVIIEVATDRRRRALDTYSFGEAEPFDHRYPKYVIEATERAALKLLKSGKVTFYEYDRDGEKRYTDLRYHDEHNTAWMIECLERDYAQTEA